MILVVDDQKDVRDLIAKLLRKKGYGVLDAVDGKEAEHFLSALKAIGERPVAIITDLEMPRLNGWQLASVAREWFPCVPVVYMSGGEESHLLTLPGAPAVFPAADFIAKPFSMEELVRRVKTTP